MKFNTCCVATQQLESDTRQELPPATGGARAVALSAFTCSTQNAHLEDFQSGMATSWLTRSISNKTSIQIPQKSATTQTLE